MQSNLHHNFAPNPTHQTDTLAELLSFPDLPEGYTYNRDQDIEDSEELAALVNKTDAFGAISAEDLEAYSLGMEDHAITQRGIAVRAADGTLVGYGLVAHKGQYGEFATLAVHPEHQGRGLGKKIVDASLCFAEHYGIENIYMPALLFTNTLRQYYFEHGFRETEAGEIVRGPNPKSVGQLIAESDAGL